MKRARIAYLITVSLLVIIIVGYVAYMIRLEQLEFRGSNEKPTRSNEKDNRNSTSGNITAFGSKLTPLHRKDRDKPSLVDPTGILSIFDDEDGVSYVAQTAMKPPGTIYG